MKTKKPLYTGDPNPAVFKEFSHKAEHFRKMARHGIDTTPKCSCKHKHSVDGKPTTCCFVEGCFCVKR